ncbi:MAG TPA: GMP synthase [Ginsengibacter sp.]|jgi:GMP synthase-like glutamine amidotransferase
MNLNEKQSVRIAILDLYEGVANQGMRGIREIINQFGEINQLNIEMDEFDVRLKNSVPDLTYDIYISSGGPGSPLESEGSEWEKNYFEWLREVEKWNDDAMQLQKKYVFFICHSFQLVCRHWQLAKVCARKSTSFGVFPIHLLEEGKEEPVFSGMNDPFYAVDSRDFQIIEPRMNMLYKGAKILCIEKDRPHLPYERAIMGIRFSDYFIGTQFHPEADAIGMTMYLHTEEKKKTVIENHGLAKWKSMIEQLNDPDKILWTYAHILPNFLNIALNSLHLVPA